MEVRLLGPLELADGGRSIAYGGARQRAVLALLVLHANQVLASERVLMELWGEDAPPGAANALQAAVSRLRRALPQGRLVTRPPGYLFRAVPDEVDLSRFELVLSNKSGFCHGVRPARGARHVCYCLSPTRYVWDFESYAGHGGLGRAARLALRPILSWLRRWDFAAAQLA